MALERAGVAFTQHTYEHDPAATSYGLEAADALGLDPSAVFKTLLADVDGRLVVGIVPVTGQLDLKALAAAVGGKRASMADPAVAERTTGLRRRRHLPDRPEEAAPTVLDASALDLPTVYVSGGKRGLDLGLDPRDLVTLLDARIAAIARGRSRLLQRQPHQAVGDVASVQTLTPNAAEHLEVVGDLLGVLVAVLADQLEDRLAPVAVEVDVGDRLGVLGVGDGVLEALVVGQ